MGVTLDSPWAGRDFRAAHAARYRDPRVGDRGAASRAGDRDRDRAISRQARRLPPHPSDRRGPGGLARRDLRSVDRHGGGGAGAPARIRNHPAGARPRMEFRRRSVGTQSRRLRAARGDPRRADRPAASRMPQAVPAYGNSSWAATRRAAYGPGRRSTRSRRWRSKRRRRTTSRSSSKAPRWKRAGRPSGSPPQAAYTFNSQGVIQLPVGNVANLVATPAGGGNPYIAGTDYTLDAVNGIITQTAGGTIPSGATVNVVYTYSETVTAVADGSSSPTAPTN